LREVLIGFNRRNGDTSDEIFKRTLMDDNHAFLTVGCHVLSPTSALNAVGMPH